MTLHAVLIEQAARWLARKGFPVVITDMSHGGGETADAIGWNGCSSTLVECKASVSDFRADAEKFFRRYPERGMSPYRYYCAPMGLLRSEWLPARWGLLEWDGRRLWLTVKAEHQTCDCRAETSLLVSALRRVGQVCPRGISVKVYTMDSKCRATLGIEADEEWSI